MPRPTLTARQHRLLDAIEDRPGSETALLRRAEDHPIESAYRWFAEDLQILVDRGLILRGHVYEGEVSWHYWPVRE